MKPAEHVEIRIAREFSVPGERVFDAWLDPKTAGNWLFATPEGRMVGVEIDPRVGGEFLFVDRRDGEDVEHTGLYLEIDRPRRLSFSLSVARYAGDATRIVLDIVRLGRGCELTLTHLGVPPENAERTESGWAAILDGLEEALGSYDPDVESGTKA